MPAYAFYADAEHKRRPDGFNTLVASGASVSAARAAAETLLGEPGSLAAFAAVDLTAAPAFGVQGFMPVGARSQATWPTADRGGSLMKGS